MLQFFYVYIKGKTYDLVPYLIIVSGPAGLKHPAIFGIYDLDTVFGSRPAYVRRIVQQNMFYKEIYDKWDYDHKIER